MKLTAKLTGISQEFHNNFTIPLDGGSPPRVKHDFHVDKLLGLDRFTVHGSGVQGLRFKVSDVHSEASSTAQFNSYDIATAHVCQIGRFGRRFRGFGGTCG